MRLIFRGKPNLDGAAAQAETMGFAGKPAEAKANRSLRRSARPFCPNAAVRPADKKPILSSTSAPFRPRPSSSTHLRAPPRPKGRPPTKPAPARSPKLPSSTSISPSSRQNQAPPNAADRVEGGHFGPRARSLALSLRFLAMGPLVLREEPGEQRGSTAPHPIMKSSEKEGAA